MATRYEKVVLDLEDRFTGPMARAAAATQVLDKSLDSLSGSSVRTARETEKVDRSIDKMSKTAGGSTREVDRLSGRLRLFADIAAILGPGLVPITALAVPAITGMASALGFTAIAGGSVIAAFQGIGDALKVVNEAQLVPTEENLTKARDALEKLSPAAQDFTQNLSGVTSSLRDLRDSGAEALFPGMSEALDSLERRLPDVERIMVAINSTVGEMLADGAESLASSRWDDFFEFIGSEAPPALESIGSSLGNAAHAMSELWMAFDPLNDDFLSWLADATAGLDRWAEGLSQTDGFREFVAYVRETGPQVADTLGSLGMALIRIGEAAAPLGGPVLRAVEAVADVLGALANSRVGPSLIAIASGMALLSRALKGVEAIKASALFTGLSAGADDASRKMTALGRAAVGLGALQAVVIAINAIDDATREGLPGVEKLTGQLIDLQAGQVAALGSEFDSLSDSIGRLADPNAAEKAGDAVLTVLTLGQAQGRRKSNAKDEIEALDAALSNLVSEGGAELAEQSFTALAEAQGLSAEETENLLGLLPQYGEALESAANDAALEARETRSAVESHNELAAAIEAQMEAMRELRSERIRAANAELNYQASLDDARKALKENGATLDKTTDKGRANRTALLQMAAAWNDQSDKVKNAKGAHQDAIGAFVKMAGQMGMNREEARKYALRLFEIPEHRRTKVDLETGQALGKIAALEARLKGIADEDVFINVRHRKVGNESGFGPQDNGQLARTDVNAADRASLTGQIAGVFNDGITGGGLAGLGKTLTGDIANRQAMDQALAQLASMGLDVTGPLGGLYAELAASGDVATARELASGGAGLIDYYEQLYAQRAQLNASSGAALAGQIKPVDLQRVSEESAGYMEEIRDLLVDVLDDAKQDWKDAKEKRKEQLEETKKGPKVFAAELKSITSDVGRKGGR